MPISVRRSFIFICSLVFISACQNTNQQDLEVRRLDDDVLATWIAQASPQIAKDPSAYRLQVLFTEIRREDNGLAMLRQHNYRADAEYLYPASTVKLAIAALALEYMQQLSGYGVTIDSVMHTEPLLEGDTLVAQDTSASSGLPSVRHYVKKILLVSDNDAYNRLYELMGQQYINKRLTQLGFTNAQILHRLDRSLSPEENRATNPISFYDAKGKLLYRQPAKSSTALPARPITLVGNDYLKNGELQGKPLDFSQKNNWPLSHMHRLTQMIMLPETLPPAQRLQLAKADLQFLQRHMAMLPAASTSPTYDKAQYWPSYVKFLVYGAEKNAQIDPNLHIHNKVGDAYGFLLDSAYIKDDCSGAEFMMTAALYVNKDGVLNDDNYDYDTVGLPFLKRLGELAVANARAKPPSKCTEKR